MTAARWTRVVLGLWLFGLGAGVDWTARQGNVVSVACFALGAAMALSLLWRQRAS